MTTSEIIAKITGLDADPRPIQFPVLTDGHRLTTNGPDAIQEDKKPWKYSNAATFSAEIIERRRILWKPPPTAAANVFMYYSDFIAVDRPHCHSGLANKGKPHNSRFGISMAPA